MDLAQDREHRATDTTRPQQDLLKWAEGRFLAAGLTPPSPHVHFASGLDHCEGHPGVYQPGADRITICVGDHASDFIRRPLILHELAHAWAHEHLTADDRAAFVELRGAVSWNDRDDPWAERATEHAAETIAWGLMDVAVDFGASGPTDDSSLRSAFLSLTGVAPINDGSHPADDATEAPEPTVSART